jgi:hypothetical protein
MFYEIVDRKNEPSEFQLQRLRAYEMTSRFNSVLYESFDMGTDITFMLVLFGK